MIRYLIAGLAVMAIALGGVVWFQSTRIDRLKTENEALKASIRAYEIDRDLAREAQAVAEARAEAIEAKAQEYDALRESVLREGEDAKLPDWLLNVIASLRADPDR